MQKLVAGIHQFHHQIQSERPDLLSRMSRGQEPLALFITCSDSRIVPNQITQTDPGELFILRTAGNIVPPYGAVQGGEAATIEYAITALNVTDVIVCGHSLCGAMGALLDPAQVRGMPAVEAILKHAEATRRIMDENYAHLADPVAKLTATVQENVLVQLENLRTHPSVAAAMARGALQLHAWVFKMQTAEVFAYHPDIQQFRTLLGPQEQYESPSLSNRTFGRPSLVASMDGAA
jgi:carbonic anhydrase